jgi:hypothetical protein
MDKTEIKVEGYTVLIFRWYSVREFMMFHCNLLVQRSELGKPLAVKEQVQGEGYVW